MSVRRAALALALLTAACSSNTPHHAAATTIATTTTTTESPPEQIFDLTWISETHGWALERAPLSIWTTTDGGDTWRRVDKGAPLENVGSIRFANPTVGYAFGPGLMTTNDGGVTWQTQPGRKVAALEANGTDVIRLSYDHDGCPGPCDWKIEKATVGATTWRDLHAPKLRSQGDSARLARQGRNDVYAMFAGNPAGGGEAESDILVSRDGGATWASRGEPCWPSHAGPELDSYAIAAAPNGVVAALCNERTNESPSSVVVSTDGGRTFGPPRTTGLHFLGEVAITSADDIIVSTGSTTGGGPITYRVGVSHDGGRTWTTAVSDDEEAGDFDHAWLGFESAKVGRWVGDPSTIWTTRDGGDHWKAHRFGS